MADSFEPFWSLHSLTTCLPRAVVLSEVADLVVVVVVVAVEAEEVVVVVVVEVVVAASPLRD